MDRAVYEKTNAGLIREYDERLKANIKVSMDGAVDSDTYFKQSPKILFILKEQNGSPFDEDSHLLEYLRNETGGGGKTWNNVVRWTLGIESVFKRNSAEYYDSVTKELRRNTVQRIAVINMKKVPGSSTSEMGTIDQYARHFSDLTAAQIALLDPDVIVTCVSLKRVTGFCTLDFDTTPSKVGYVHMFKEKPRIVLHSYHPQSRRKARAMYDSIYEACQEAYKNVTK